MTQKKTTTGGRQPTQAAAIEITPEHLQLITQMFEAVASTMASSGALGVGGSGGPGPYGPQAKLGDHELEVADAVFAHQMISGALGRSDGSFRGARSPFIKLQRRDTSLIFDGQPEGHTATVIYGSGGQTQTATAVIDGYGHADFDALPADAVIVSVTVREPNGQAVAIAGGNAITSVTDPDKTPTYETKD